MATASESVHSLRNRRTAIAHLRAIEGPHVPARRALQREMLLEAAARNGRTCASSPLPKQSPTIAQVSGEDSPGPWVLGSWSPRSLTPRGGSRENQGPVRYTRLQAELENVQSERNVAGTKSRLSKQQEDSPRKRRYSAVWVVKGALQSPEMAWGDVPLDGEFQQGPNSPPFTMPTPRRRSSNHPLSPLFASANDFSLSPTFNPPSPVSLSPLSPSPRSPFSPSSTNIRSPRVSPSPKSSRTSPRYPPRLKPIKVPLPARGLPYFFEGRGSNSKILVSPPGAFDSPTGGYSQAQSFLFRGQGGKSFGATLSQDGMEGMGQTRSRLQKVDSVPSEKNFAQPNEESRNQHTAQSSESCCTDDEGRQNVSSPAQACEGAPGSSPNSPTWGVSQDLRISKPVSRRENTIPVSSPDAPSDCQLSPQERSKGHPSQTPRPGAVRSCWPQRTPPPTPSCPELAAFDSSQNEATGAGTPFDFPALREEMWGDLSRGSGSASANADRRDRRHSSPSADWPTEASEGQPPASSEGTAGGLRLAKGRPGIQTEEDVGTTALTAALEIALTTISNPDESQPSIMKPPVVQTKDLTVERALDPTTAGSTTSLDESSHEMNHPVQG